MSDNQKFKAKKAHVKIVAATPAVSGDGKLGTHNIHRDSGVKDQNISGEGKKGIHRTASDAKNPANRTGSKLKKK